MEIINKLRRNKLANYYILFTRFLIGFAFIPSGLVKVFGDRFTKISTDNPIGYFFEGLYQTGMYYQFLGIAQLFAAFLLFTQTFARFGALLFMVIITNIVVITISMDFNYTPVITISMLLANITLILWDWEKIRVLINTKEDMIIHQSPELLSKNWTYFGFALYVVLVGLLCVGRFFFS